MRQSIAKLLFALLFAIGCTNEGPHRGFQDFVVGYPFFCLNDTYDVGVRTVNVQHTLTFTLLNVGNGTITDFSGADVSAPFAFPGGSFPGTGGTCNTALASGEACTFTVTFTPTELTTYENEMNVRIKTMGATREVSCTFTGQGTRSGVLDTSFHTDGELSVSFLEASDGSNAVAVQSDRKPVIVGYATVTAQNDFGVLRLTTSGALDTTFHTDGKVTTGNTDTAVTFAIATDSKLVVAGYTDVGALAFGVVRYHTDGSLDTSFSTDGIGGTQFAAGAHTVRSVLLHPNGAVTVAGSADIFADDYFAVARFSSSGALDTSFHTDGKHNFAFAVSTDDAIGAYLQSDGKLLMGGMTDNGADSQALARLTTSGALDTSFHTDGKATTSIYEVWELGGFSVQSDGLPILSYNWPDPDSKYHFGMTRFTTSGQLDTAFHTDGAVVQNFTTAAAFSVDEVVFQTNGQILMGGDHPIAPDFHFGIGRWTSSGELDTTFGSGGLAHTVSIKAMNTSQASLVVSQDQIYRIGRNAPTPGSNSSFGIARFWQ